jgi:hypothetical protein
VRGFYNKRYADYIYFEGKEVDFIRKVLFIGQKSLTLQPIGNPTGHF